MYSFVPKVNDRPDHHRDQVQDWGPLRRDNAGRTSRERSNTIWQTDFFSFVYNQVIYSLQGIF